MKHVLQAPEIITRQLKMGWLRPRAPTNVRMKILAGIFQVVKIAGNHRKENTTKKTKTNAEGSADIVMQKTITEHGGLCLDGERIQQYFVPNRAGIL